MPQPEFTLETALSLDECADRLVKATTPMRGVVAVFPFTAKMPVIAKIQLNEFELRKRPFFLYNDDAFARCFGQLLPSTKGTRIKGRFGLGRAWRLYLVVWTAFAALVGLPLFAITLIEILSGRYQPNAWVGILVPLAVI